MWVHIADVSHYVKPGTPLDVEARKRGNSTYLVDRVIPMLPEALSNELCSLKPDVDRLTKCVEFLIANDGRVVSTKFYPAVIHSQRRFNYGEVLALLQQTPTGDPIEQMLHEAHELAQKIRRRRFKAGSLELDFPETKIRLDEQGRVLRIEKIENDVSHQLIEEYMLLANEAVAARLMGLHQPAIYRVHEEPDERRLQEYREEVLAPSRALRQFEPTGRRCRNCCKSWTPCPSAPRSRSAFSTRSCARVTRSSRSAITVWPRRNTRISPRPSAATPTSWCIARCSIKTPRPTSVAQGNRRPHFR